jgi:hypothetical protein
LKAAACLLSRLFGAMLLKGRFERMVIEDLNVSGMSKKPRDCRSCNVLTFEFTPLAALPKRRATCRYGEAKGTLFMTSLAVTTTPLDATLRQLQRFTANQP